MSGIHFGQAVGGRKLEDLSANELRARLIRAGKDVPKDIKTKEDGAGASPLFLCLLLLKLLKK